MAADVINSHVSRLGSYLTFEPNHDQIYEERSDPEQLRTIETRALYRLLELVDDGSVHMVVLTGDAGHGKTHLCRVVVEKKLKVNAPQALELLMESGGGDRPLGEFGGRPLHVVRDLSELRHEAIDRLRDAVSQHDQITIVCANEGKLREVVASAEGDLDVLRETLEGSVRTGCSWVRPGIVVLDLNHQSVTKGGEDSFLGGLLGQWVMDGRRWNVCLKWPVSESCPILRNRNQLAGSDNKDKGGRRREGLHLLLRVTEQTGHAITIRETLILTAFLITGGLNCRKVQESVRRDPDDSWQHERLFFQVLFDPPLTYDQLATLPLLKVLSRFDPGRNSIRSIDESLVVGTIEEEGSFLPPHSSVHATPRSRKQARTEASRHQERTAYLRRRDFFDLDTNDFWRRIRGEDARIVSRAERLGFRFHELFEDVVARESDGTSMSSIRDRIIRGLEAVQDVRRGSKQTTSFAVIDPAYGSVSGSASILSAMISIKRIEIMTLARYWDDITDGRADLPALVDWIDRKVVITFRSKHRESVSVELSLLQFEFVVRSAEGLACRGFFQGEIRRILARLTELAERADRDEEEIRVVHGDRLLSILVEADGRIVCETNS